MSSFGSYLFAALVGLGIVLLTAFGVFPHEDAYLWLLLWILMGVYDDE